MRDKSNWTVLNFSLTVWKKFMTFSGFSEFHDISGFSRFPDWVAILTYYDVIYRYFLLLILFVSSFWFVFVNAIIYRWYFVLTSLDGCSTNRFSQGNNHERTYKFGWGLQFQTAIFKIGWCFEFKQLTNVQM